MNRTGFNLEEDEKFFSEFKEKMAMDPLSDSVRYTQNKTSKKQIFAIVVLIVLSACAGICWNMYASYIATKEPAGNIISLSADTTADKVRPTSPGGMEISNTDKTIYDRFSAVDKVALTDEVVISQPLTDSTNTGATLADILSISSDIYAKKEPQPTVPNKEENNAEVTSSNVAYSPASAEAINEEREEDASSQDIKAKDEYKPLFASASSDNNSKNTDKVIIDSDKVISTSSPVIAPTVTEKVEDKPVTKSVSSPTKVAKVATEVQPRRIKQPKVAEEPAKDNVKTVYTNPVSTLSGEFRIQLLSSTIEKAVRNSWADIYAKHKDILEDYSYEVVEANVNGKTLYRLRIVAFTTRKEANRICSALKDRGQDCLVTNK